MTTALIAVAVVLTSVGAYLVGTRALGLTPARLRHAGARTADCIGLGMVFLALNLAIGGLAVLALRLVTGQFFPLYALNDGTIVILSVLQGMVVQWWRGERP
jgi:hypothetical protein